MTFVGKVSDVTPGRLLAIDVEGKRVVVANVEGRFFAIGDRCTHRGCSVSDGELSGTVVTSPCHGGQFDLTNGEVVAGPPRESTPTYFVQVVGDEFRIG